MQKTTFRTTNWHLPARTIMHNFFVKGYSYQFNHCQFCSAVDYLMIAGFCVNMCQYYSQYTEITISGTSDWSMEVKSWSCRYICSQILLLNFKQKHLIRRKFSTRIAFQRYVGKQYKKYKNETCSVFLFVFSGFFSECY